MCNLAALLALHERERAFHWAERAVETGQAAALVQMALLMNANDFRHAATLLDRAAEQARELPLARRIAVRTALRTLGLGNSLDATWRRVRSPRGLRTVADASAKDDLSASARVWDFLTTIGAPLVGRATRSIYNRRFRRRDRQR